MVTFSLDDSGNDVDADRYDIEESFGALDLHKTGRLEFDLACTLLLGLGYLGNYKKKDDFTPGILKQLTKQIENDDLLKDGSSSNNVDEGIELGIKLETLLTIVATHPTLLQRNSSDNFNFAKIGFELIDHDRKGYINASDIQRLSNDVGKNIDNNEVVTTKISIDEAKAMIETTNDMFAQNYNNDDNNDDDDNNHRLESVVFQKLFTSPFP